ncbi:SAV_915 family protein [Streptomyces sp. NPDC057654]|uniref:SAV_915 family protein n=1 Tax=Streptomyces sp. NPDC057654 TaxID=3346196 RepID=UPI0036C43585
MGEQTASRILDYVGDDAGDAAAAARSRVPAYSTPVFVPAHPRYPDEGPPRIAFELLRHPAGPAVPVAFTSLHKLVDALGPAQPWIASSIGPFVEAMREANLPKVHLDPVIAPGHRNWQLESIEAYARELNS